MSNIGMVTIAQRRNKIKAVELASHLDRLEKERKGEMRIHNTIKQRFRAKHSKLDGYIGNSEDNPEVRMYETHNPGFCYRRNGECRIPQVPITAPVVDYEDLHDMLFTHGELDAEKVICLHLLTAHLCESLAPVVKPTGFISKDQCPLERLIERSKKKRNEYPILKILPLYTIDTSSEVQATKKQFTTSNISLKDGRIAFKILINEKIQSIIATVLTALSASSPEKLNALIKTAENTETLINILEKPSNQAFLRNLQGQTLISSCESFYLSQPFKTPIRKLYLPISAKTLEPFINFIRNNVLQYPLKKLSTKRTNDEILEDIALPDQRPMRSSHSSYASIHMSSTPSMVAKFSGIKETTSVNKRNIFDVNKSATEKPVATTSSRDVKDVWKKMSKEINIGQSIKEVQEENEDAKVEKTSMEPMKPKKKTKRRLSIKDAKMLVKDIDHDGLANLLNRMTNKAMKHDLDELNEKREETELEECDHSVEDASILTPNIYFDHARVSIRRSNCPACLMRWKKPLPTPKTPVRINLPDLNQTNYKSFTTESIHIISTIIDREFLKLETYRENEKKKNTVWNNRKEVDKKPSKVVLETVNLDAIDLAKINQEIREKETQQKLEKFLKGEFL